ncbi:hypothetical protein [Campylobacter sp. US33a]|uniref:Periplasmic protein n=1 Tax=Campylobacter sp. CCS1377 TaxID=3158229 RepID=A0AAU7E9V1_9BACT|nr:hypothetical protein [Campylobacter sp. US33a]TEY04455.1 hypothetical protein ELQ16_00040 [Campylobacter sp. US33a]
MKVKLLVLALGSACVLSAAPFEGMMNECVKGDRDCPNFHHKGPKRGGEFKGKHYRIDPVIFERASFEQKQALVKSYYQFKLERHKQNSSTRQEILKLEEKLELLRIEFDELKKTNADNAKINQTLAKINSTQEELRKSHENLRNMHSKALDEKFKRDNKILGF